MASKQDSSSEWEPDSDHSEGSDQGDEWYDQLSEGENSPAPDDEDEQWHNDTGGLRNIPFTGSGGLQVPPPGENRPIDYFFLLLDDAFLESIVRETNRLAAEEKRLPSTSAGSRVSKWRDVTVEELKVFLALVLHTGTIRLDHLQDYWKTDSLFNIPFFREHMSRDRFLIILRFLSFSTPSKNERPGCPKKVIDFFNSKMREVYSPSRDLCVDDPALLLNGRIYSGQDVEVRSHSGMTFFSLSEPQGLVLKFLIDRGCSVDRGGKAKSYAAKVVLDLMNDFLDKGHSLYTDKFYSGVALASQLFSRNTHFTGILSPDRKCIPRAVKGARLKKGESTARYADGVVVGKWRRTHTAIMYISTEHGNENVFTMNSSGDLGGKPLPVIKYNANMKAVDRTDQLLSFYPCQPTTLSRPKKIFVHVLQIIMVNSWLLYSMTNVDSKLSRYDYRLQVIRALLPPAAPRPPEAKRARRTHVLSIVEKGTDGKRRAKRCRVCNQKGVRRETVYFCAQCSGLPGLCAVGCFDLFHVNL